MDRDLEEGFNTSKICPGSPLSSLFVKGYYYFVTSNYSFLFNCCYIRFFDTHFYLV